MGKRRRIIVVGAGVAGLAAARLLQNLGNFDVTILEANPDRPGGRVCTIEMEDYPGRPVELGAMWIHYGEDPSNELAKYCSEVGLTSKLSADRFLSSSVLCDQGKMTKITEHSKLCTEFFEILDQTSQIFLDDPQLKDIPIMDAVSRYYSEWVKNHLTEPAVEHYLLQYLRGWTGDKLDLISARFRDDFHDEQRCISYSGRDTILTGGYRSLIHKLINGSTPSSSPLDVRLGHQVIAVRVENNGAHVSITVADGSMFLADFAVVAVPLGILKAGTLKFEPDLSSSHKAAISRIGFGNYAKAVLVFDEVFWPNNIEYFWPSAEPRGIVMLFANLYAHNGVKALIAAISGENAYLADQLSDVDLKERVLDVVNQTFGSVSVKHKLVGFQRTNWRKNPFIRGAYSYGMVGMRREDAYNIRVPHCERVFFAGEHTTFPEEQHGTVTGAFLSGNATANLINTAAAVDSARNISLKMERSKL